MGQIEDDDRFRISLAGAQEKTALLWRNEQWHLPHGATPTTHIFKLPLGANRQGIDLTTSVENEWLCAQIVQAYGDEVPPCRMDSFGPHKVLIVERFDRKLSSDGTWWLRLPQEDLCQATGTPPGLKYENEGGPGIRKIMDLLLGSVSSQEDRRSFLRTQVVFWLLAAIDGHAKNFSVFLLAKGEYKLTPRYDILSAYPVLGHGFGKLHVQKIRMAMAVEGKSRHYRWNEIHGRHWSETANRCGMAAEMKSILSEIVESTPSVLDKVSNKIPPEFPTQVRETIFQGLRTASDQLKSDIAAF